jgi:two-component system, chemotaxis family, sensor kinase CheA
MDDLIQEFLAETTESLGALDLDIVKLEQNPNDKDLIGRIFRLVHTIKGTCGFLGLPRLETVAHRSENVLGRYREGSLLVTEESVSLILAAFDRIKIIVGGLAATGAEPAGDDSDLISLLDAVYEGKAAPAPAPAPVAAAAPAEPELPPMETIDDFVPVPAPGVVIAAPAAAAAAPAAPPPAPAPAAPKAAAEHAPPAKPVDEASATLRVSVDVLENLMTMVSELVLTRNQLLQILRTQGDSPFTPPLQRLNHVVSELQEGVMRTRMQPIGNAWSKLPRIVRDISVELGKKISLDMRGQETELDRQVLDLIKDPLTHMVRNSADHGIEKPDERKTLGKPEEGTIQLNAFHEGGHIIIEISDDGKGLNTERIRAKAVQNGVVSEDQARNLSDKQVQQFIFAAGFSTAEKVTSVSGRGVGMDVVRTNIEKIGGTIEMNSVFGKGTTFTIKIPLTLAIVSALIVEAGNERYAVPQLSVRELVRLSDEGGNRLEEIHGAPVMRLRDRLLPLVSLRVLLKIDGEIPKGQQVIVVQVGASNFGIIVDRVFDTEEIVVKPVSPILKNIRLFSGNTILGDGNVIMILDPNGIASAVSGSIVQGGHGKRDDDVVHGDEGRTSLLVFKAGSGAPRAVPLTLVSRLEEVEVNRIEESADRKVVQYRGKLMPLVPFSDKMTLKEGDEAVQSVLVFTDRERAMGLMVDEIVDIVEERIDVQIAASGHKGLLGSAIVHGQAMDVIDVGHFLALAHSDWFGGASGKGQAEVKGKRKRVLLLDDSPFFRNMLAPMLSASGCDVSTAEHPDAALALCRGGQGFDVIVSDIEMPGMSGFEFAQAVRALGGDFATIPMVAMSAHASADDLERGKAAGFTNYIAKFDRDALLKSIGNLGEAA